MMTTNDGRCLRSEVGRMRTEGGEGRDTEVCGDPKVWFPMRVTYQREMKVKAELDRLGIENFVPMTYRVVESRNDGITDKRKHGETELLRELVPAINNLIFVRLTQERISELKRTNEVLEPLRYMMDRTASREHAIMTVGDREMENFMRVASRTDDSVMFLDVYRMLGGQIPLEEIEKGLTEIREQRVFMLNGQGQLMGKDS